MSRFQRICLFQIILLTLTKADGNGETNMQKFEGDGCDKLIPSFINQIIENEHDGECEQTGEYPKPGDCTVFFKCIRGRGRILPFLEYCAAGYTFVEDACIPNNNSTDCPQFNCFPVKTVAEASQAQDTKSDKVEIQNPDNDTKDKHEKLDAPEKHNLRVTNRLDDSLANEGSGIQTKMPLHNGTAGFIGLKIEAGESESERITAAQKSSSSPLIVIEHSILQLFLPFIVASFWM